MSQLRPEEVYQVVRDAGAVPPLDRILVAAAFAASDGDPDASAEDGHGLGLWLLDDRKDALAAGQPKAARRDPERAAAFLLPHLRDTYLRLRDEGLEGDDLAVETYLQTLRPEGFDKARSKAKTRFRHAWDDPALWGFDDAPQNPPDLATEPPAAPPPPAPSLRPSDPSETPETPPEPCAPPADDRPLRDAVMLAAAQRLGTPFRLDPPPDGVNNLDCSLFVLQAFRAAGAPFAGVRTVEQIRSICRPVPWDDVQRGDLLFFEDTYADSEPSLCGDGVVATHLGISEGAGTLMMWDCNETHGAGRTHVGTPYWQAHLFEARRPPQFQQAPLAAPQPRDPPPGGDAPGVVQGMADQLAYLQGAMVADLRRGVAAALAADTVGAMRTAIQEKIVPAVNALERGGAPPQNAAPAPDRISAPGEV